MTDTSTPTILPDQLIYNAIRTGTLRPHMVGLRQFEVRFYGLSERRLAEDECDMVSVIFDDTGRVGSFLHCELSASDIASDTIEGIGGEYADYFEGGGYYPTVSYLSDDPELSARIAAVVA